MSEQSLKDKTLKGVTWTAADTVLRYGITFVVGIILARILSPDEYGLIGILTIFIELFNIIVDGGFANALIQKKNADEVDFCTVFFVNLALSVILAALMYLSAGLISKFFERDELLNLTRVMSVIVIINAFAVVQKARLTKMIDFKTQTKVSVYSNIASGLIGIGMAYAGFGVWALVGQQISSALVTTVLFWILSKWVPKIMFSKESFKGLWSFGWKLMLSGIFNSLSGQLHNIVIGKIYSPATLGQYTRANQFGGTASSSITTIIQRVSFPVLSEIQDDPIYLKAAYKKVIKMTVFPTFILMMGLVAVSKSLIVMLIGEKWIEASVYLQILCFSMMLFPLHALNLNAIQVMGRSDLTLKINIIKNLLIIVPVALGIIFNIYAMLIADVIRGYICYYLNAYYSRPLLNYPIEEQLKDIMPIFIISVVMAVPVFAMSFLPLPAYLLFVLQVIAGGVLTFIICESIKQQEYLEYKQILKPYINRIIKR